MVAMGTLYPLDQIRTIMQGTVVPIYFSSYFLRLKLAYFIKILGFS
jgi:hypothetical protein